MYKVEINEYLAEWWLERGKYEESVEALKAVLSKHKDLINQTPEAAYIYIITDDWQVIRLNRNGSELQVEDVSTIDSALITYPPTETVRDKVFGRHFERIKEHHVIFKGNVYRVSGLRELRGVLSELRQALERAEVDPKLRAEALRHINYILGNIETKLVEYSVEYVLNREMEDVARRITHQIVYFLEQGVGEGALLKYAEHLRQRFTEREVVNMFKKAIEEFLRWRTDASELRARVEYLRSMRSLFKALGLDFNELMRDIGIDLKRIERPAAVRLGFTV